MTRDEARQIQEMLGVAVIGETLDAVVQRHERTLQLIVGSMVRDAQG